MTSYLATLFRRSPHRKAFADLLQLDDHLLRDIGVSRSDLYQRLRGPASRVRTHE